MTIVHPPQGHERKRPRLTTPVNRNATVLTPGSSTSEQGTQTNPPTNVYQPASVSEDRTHVRAAEHNLPNSPAVNPISAARGPAQPPLATATLPPTPHGVRKYLYPHHYPTHPAGPTTIQKAEYNAPYTYPPFTSQATGVDAVLGRADGLFTNVPCVAPSMAQREINLTAVLRKASDLFSNALNPASFSADREIDMAAVLRKLDIVSLTDELAQARKALSDGEGLVQPDIKAHERVQAEVAKSETRSSENQEAANVDLSNDTAILGSIDNPIQIPGFSGEELVRVLVGKELKSEFKVLRSAMCTLLFESDLQGQMDTVDTNGAIVLEGIESDVFQQMIVFVYSGYPERSMNGVIRGYTNIELQLLYQGAKFFNLYDTANDIITVYDEDSGSVDNMAFARNVYSIGEPDDQFRDFTRRNFASMLDQATMPDTIKYVVKDLEVSQLMLEDLTTVFIDREIIRAAAGEAGAASNTSGWDELGNGTDYVNEADKDEINSSSEDDGGVPFNRSLFITNFPHRSDTQQIMNSLLTTLSCAQVIFDIDISMLRSEGRRYAQIVFDDDLDARMGFAALQKLSLRSASHDRILYVNWAHDDVNQNFADAEIKADAQNQETEPTPRLPAGLRDAYAVAIKDSDAWCSLKFKAGNILSKVNFESDPNGDSDPLLNGVLGWNFGCFASSFVRFDYTPDEEVEIARLDEGYHTDSWY